MKRLVVLSMIVVMAAVMPLMAGEGQKCKAPTQDCLDHMATALKGRGWVGIEFNQETMTITGVIPDSPAQQAGFQPGDVMVAVNGTEFADASKDEMEKVHVAMVPGGEMTYTMDRGGDKIDLDVTLGELPKDVLAQWIGMHMLEGHAQVKVASTK